jgi:uncharacterized protein (DUF4415 family)
MNATLTKTRLGERLEDDRTDWKRVDALGEAELAKAIQDDPEAFEPGVDWIRKAAVPHPAEAKERITMRLDADMLAWFRQQGRGYQTRINAVLRAYVEAHQPSRRR